MSTDRLSESEAMALAGVSAATLKRFADAGYLRVGEEGEEKIYSRSEFESLFGGSIPASRTSTDTIQSDRPRSSDALMTQDIQESGDVITLHTIAAENDHPVNETHSEVENQNEEKITLSTMEKDLIRLKTLVHLQERLIEGREREIDRLSEERNWLRERVEKLEEKANRDQLILVSVTETNRGLVSAIEKKRSPIQAALEWLGVLPETLPAVKTDLQAQPH